jgi:putative peptide maturation system protein
MLDDALDTLRGLRDMEPEQAQERLKDLRARHPEARFRLLWQREEWDDSLHYDLLVKSAAEGTISLSWSPDRALPWPLRGVHRASELLLLRVDGVDVTVADAVARVDFLWDEARLADRIVAGALLQADLEESPIELTPSELQVAVDAFRRARGLLTQEQTHAWLDRRSLTLLDLEKLVAGEAAAVRVRERVTAGKVESYFQEHRAEFGQARAARLSFPDPGSAWRAATEIGAGADFYAVAEQTAGASLVIESMSLAEVGPARVGEIVGPTGDDALLKVISVSPATLDPRTRRLVQERIFDEWLDERRRAAKIEWFWGTTARTSTL